MRFLRIIIFSILFFIISISSNSYVFSNDIKTLNDQLIAASTDGDLAGVKTFIKQGADINYYVEYRGTPLNFASINGHLEIVKYLVENGADIHFNKFNDTPLRSTSVNGHLEIVKYLIMNGVKINCMMIKI